MADWKEDIIEKVTPIATVVANEISKDPGKALATAGTIAVEAAPILVPAAIIGAAGYAGYWIGKKIGDIFF